MPYEYFGVSGLPTLLASVGGLLLPEELLTQTSQEIQSLGHQQATK